MEAFRTVYRIISCQYQMSQTSFPDATYAENPIHARKHHVLEELACLSFLQILPENLVFHILI